MTKKQLVAFANSLKSTGEGIEVKMLIASEHQKPHLFLAHSIAAMLSNACRAAAEVTEDAP